MFSPDIFYEILWHRYDWPKTPNALLAFANHGDKDISDLVPFAHGADQPIAKLLPWHGTKVGDFATMGKIILHDQEPVNVEYLAYTYRQRLIRFGKDRFRGALEYMQDHEALNCYIKSGFLPIICHSEKNSRDIQTLRDHANFLDCYYWYHGMIARDWFKYQQYHPDLLVRDKSSSEYRFLIYARAMDGTRSYRKDFLDMMVPLKSMINHDWENKRDIKPEFSAVIDAQDANNSTIHVVLETLFNTDKIHLTEKVFKPMIMSQPFLLVAPPNSLAYLKDYGFQTFNHVWDESYDLERDPSRRMHMVIDIIKHLASISEHELTDIYKKCLPVIEHNRQHFFNDKFRDHLIREMDYNFDRALAEQLEKAEMYPGGMWAKTLSDMIERGMTDVPPLWQPLTNQFLTSPFLSVPVQKVIDRYPALSRFLGPRIENTPVPPWWQIPSPKDSDPL